MVCGPQAAQSKGQQNLWENENLNKKSNFLVSIYFTLKHIEGNSINYSDLLLNFVVSVRDAHCDYSVQAPTSLLATPLDGIRFP